MKSSWRSPSNIALVKYWGKFGVQLPQNPSISFTLSAAHTDTSIAIKAGEAFGLDFYFEGQEAPSFSVKISNFLSNLDPIFSWIKDHHFTIYSKNSFPHSAGIASSASAMSAIALCLEDLNEQISGETFNIERVSEISRLGSGSASRSVFPYAAIWGEGSANSSNEYAIAYEDLHAEFKVFKDTILIVSSEEKAVSSRAGHALMEDNPFAIDRYKIARKNLTEIIAALASGDIEKVGTITEYEALSLHALMMLSNPSYMLMRPNTIAIIEKLQAYRKASKEAIYFTLDAGPNVHVLHPPSSSIEAFIEAELKPLCEGERIIYDQVGSGPEKLAENGDS